MDPAATPPPAPKRSLWMPMAWLLLVFLGSAGACAGIGASLQRSEDAAILATQISAFPLGFVLCGALAGLIVHFGVRRATTLLRVVGPLGCGCLGGVVLAGIASAVVLFVLPTL